VTLGQVNEHAMRRRPLGKVHNLVVVPEKWVTTLNGIRVVRPELAAYQACGFMSPARAARTFDALWSRGLLSGRSARACLEDLQQRGRDGTVVYRQIVKARGDDYVPPASNLESRVKELAEEAGIKLRRQVDLGGEQWSGRVDFYEDDVKLVVEVQSELHHTSLVDVQADAQRRARLEAAGFTFLEVWDTDIWARPGSVTYRIRQAIHHLNSCA
jgi:very-short-patch-repair endonuclease